MASSNEDGVLHFTYKPLAINGVLYSIFMSKPEVDAPRLFVLEFNLTRRYQQLLERTKPVDHRRFTIQTSQGIVHSKLTSEAAAKLLTEFANGSLLKKPFESK
jgi:hypothetical protein